MTNIHQLDFSNSDELINYVHYVFSKYSNAFAKCNDDKELRTSTLPSSTSTYNSYNAFTLLNDNSEWRKIYEQVVLIVKQFYLESGGTNDTLYLKAWLNYDDEKDVLGWHNHDSLLHGYIGVEPLDTITQFENQNIENQIGRMYIGPGNTLHRVLVNKRMNKKRITLAFDVNDDFTILHNPLIYIPINIRT